MIDQGRDAGPVPPITAGPTASRQPRRFFGSVEIDMVRPVKAFDTILSAIVTELQRTKAAKVTLTLEIEADAEDGFSEADIGVVRDNARQLKFKAEIHRGRVIAALALFLDKTGLAIRRNSGHEASLSIWRMSVEFLCSCCEAAAAGAPPRRALGKGDGHGHATRARPHQDQRGSAEGRKVLHRQFRGDRKRETPGRGCQLDLHGVQLNVTTINADQNHEQHVGIEHIAIETDDYPGALANLKKNGAQVLARGAG